MCLHQFDIETMEKSRFLYAESVKNVSGAFDRPAKSCSVWPIYDTDQRRFIVVYAYHEEEDLAAVTDLIGKGGIYTPDHPSPFAASVLRTLEQQLDQEGWARINAIHMMASGEVLSVSTKPEDDETWYPVYFPKEAYQPPEDMGTLRRSDLTEVRRLDADVDLVSYKEPGQANGEDKAAVFKHFSDCWEDQGRVPDYWRELQISMAVRRHRPANILVPDSLVLDEVDGSRVVGFASRYIPGGDLHENQSRGFKLKWLQQLIEAVDVSLPLSVYPAPDLSLSALLGLLTPS